MNSTSEETNDTISAVTVTRSDVASLFCNTLHDYVDVKQYFNHIASTNFTTSRTVI